MAVPEYITLEESARRVGQGDVLGAMVHTVFRQSQLLNRLRFKTIAGAADTFLLETQLPTPQRRQLNATFTATRSVSDIGSVAARVYGGRIQHDRAMAQMGLFNSAREMARLTQAQRLLCEYDLIYGDPEADVSAFAGLQWWAENSGVTADTSITAGSTSGGAALSVKLLRDAIDNANPAATHLVMSEPLRNLLTGGAESTGVAGFVTWQTDPFGRRIASFDNLPIVTMRFDHTNTRILGFNEAAASGAATATSLYIVSHVPDEGWFPFQNGGPSVTPLGAVPTYADLELQWILATNRVDPRSVIRVKHIGNLAIVA